MNLLKKVAANWPLKLLALVMSVFLWATYTSEPLAESAYDVRVIFRNLPAQMDLSGEEARSVQLVLRGRAALLSRLQPQDLALQVDLAERSDRDFLVSFTAANLEVPLGAEVVRITPAELRVRLVPRNP